MTCVLKIQWERDITLRWERKKERWERLADRTEKTAMVDRDRPWWRVGASIQTPTVVSFAVVAVSSSVSLQRWFWTLGLIREIMGQHAVWCVLYCTFSFRPISWFRKTYYLLKLFHKIKLKFNLNHPTYLSS